MTLSTSTHLFGEDKSGNDTLSSVQPISIPHDTAHITLERDDPAKKEILQTILACLAVVISIIAIALPLIYNATAERRSTFFRLYEYWNTDHMLMMRLRFWEIVKDLSSTDPPISLKKLREKDVPNYHVYETIYDFLNDVTSLYENNRVDRLLVDTILRGFFISYSEALKKRIIFCRNDDSITVKMNPWYYGHVGRMGKIMEKKKLQQLEKQQKRANKRKQSDT